MTDFVVWAPDLPTLQAVAQQVPGLWAPAAKGPQGTIPAHILPSGQGPELHGWAFLYVGVWNVPSGDPTTDADGNIVQPMAPKPGVYGLLRFNDDPSLMPLPKGVTLNVDPDTGIITAAAGQVTFSSDVPADFPVRFA